MVVIDKKSTRSHEGAVISAAMGQYHMKLWRHDMKALSAWLAICEGNLPLTGGSPTEIQ